MIEGLKSFGKNIKTYLGYIATLGFKDLGRHFLSLLLLIFISLLAYIPVGLLGDFVITIITGIRNVPHAMVAAKKPLISLSRCEEKEWGILMGSASIKSGLS